MSDDFKPLNVRQLDIEPIKRRFLAATQGPWGTGVDGAPFFRGFTAVTCPAETEQCGHSRVLLEMNTHFPFEADAVFIANAWQDVDNLLAEVEYLRTELAYLKAEAAQAVS